MIIERIGIKMDIIDKIKGLSNLRYIDSMSDIDILDAEEKLGVYFSDDYVKMLKTFGCVTAKGFNFTGLSDDESVNVVSVTKRERRKRIDLDGDLYILEDIISDNVRVAQNRLGEIFYLFDDMTPIKVCDGIAKYIEIREKAV